MRKMRKIFFIGFLFLFLVGCQQTPSVPSPSPSASPIETSPVETPAPVVTPTSVTLFFYSDPPGALVFLNGEEIGQTDCHKAGVLPGTYTVKIEPPEGYLGEERTVTVLGNEFTMDLRFRLEMTPEKKAELEAQKAQEEKEKEEQFKGSCEEVEYRILEKNPDAFKGKNLTFKGQIVQIIEESGITFIRLNVTYKGYDIWSDTIAVFYEGSVPVYEDDIIQVWGTGTGSYTYTSVAGYQITIPGLLAKYIEKVE